ncbi:unnamed protein product [Thlaspi arvense]|uniref:Retrotransposon gag domain-containing protein n=1 Tax=Thlaspi arvense TaxID=13288 RepID=A0AAU9RXU2_THLAR|nr:unnamed protein product [Thlaspi arvense]
MVLGSSTIEETWQQEKCALAELLRICDSARISNPVISRATSIHLMRGAVRATSPPSVTKQLLLPSYEVGFSIFHGSKLRKWIYRCDQFFNLDNTPPEQRVPLASIHLEDEALKWHHNFISEIYGLLPSWSEYVVEISSRFSGIFNDHMSELVSLKQGNDSIEVYHKKFESAYTHLVLLTSHAQSIFLTNMQPHLLLHGPTTAPLLPLPDTSSPAKSGFIPRSNEEKLPRKFSYQEIQDRRAQGQCTFCDYAFTHGHQLKHKRSHIYVLECDDEDEEELPLAAEIVTATETPPTSFPDPIPTISPTHSAVQPHSTNFPDIQVAKELGCRMEAMLPMSVAAASGDLVTHYRYSDFCWKVQGHSYTSEIQTLLSKAACWLVFNGSLL